MRSPRSRGAGGRPRDLVVVGGGTGGLVSAVVAAGAGARVTLVERERTGGDCLWTGCVPSKALLATAALRRRAVDAGEHGLELTVGAVDLARVMAAVRERRDRIEPADSPARLEREGVEVLAGDAVLAGPGLVDVGARRLRTRAVIVATGAEPALPDVPGLADARPRTSETVWDLDVLPARLTVLGGGAVGCELGQAFARLGSRVTLVEPATRLLPALPGEAAAAVRAGLERDGVRVLVGRAPSRAGAEEVVLDGDERVAHDELLVATGRRPRTAGLGLEALGVALDAAGHVRVDAACRTSTRGIWAVGDVTDRSAHTHTAAAQARVAAPNALFGLRSRVDLASAPTVVFTDPTVAVCGLDAAAARRRGMRVRVWRHPAEELDRAVVERRTAGAAELVADRRGRLLGAMVIGAGAEETIDALVPRVRDRRPVAEVSRQIHPYPTLAEGPARAADGSLRARARSPVARRALRGGLALRRLADRRGRPGGTEGAW